MRTNSELYKYHVSNLHYVSDALNRVSRCTRDSISKGDDKATSVYKRLYMLLMASWAECRLNKLQYEKDGFDDKTRKRIRTIDTQIEQWKETINEAYKVHYGLGRKKPCHETLSHAAYARYHTLIEMLDSDLKPIITLRNKLAHGQWAYPLNCEQDNVESDSLKAIKQENILSLQFKRRLVSALADIIHDLVVSCATFERDFDYHFGIITDTKRNLRNRSYEKYRDRLLDKYSRGRQKATRKK